MFNHWMLKSPTPTPLQPKEGLEVKDLSCIKPLSDQLYEFDLALFSSCLKAETQSTGPDNDCF